MNVDELKKNLHDVIERYNNKTEFCGEICRDDMARDCLQVVEELEAENEELKRELKRMEAQDQVVIDGLRKENAKLKCLAMHAMSYAVISLTSNTNKFKPFRLFMKYNEAYRKAKAKLRSSNG